jgi:hypothetical protein
MQGNLPLEAGDGDPALGISEQIQSVPSESPKNRSGGISLTEQGIAHSVTRKYVSRRK